MPNIVKYMVHRQDAKTQRGHRKGAKALKNSLCSFEKNLVSLCGLKYRQGAKTQKKSLCPSVPTSVVLCVTKPKANTQQLIAYISLLLLLLTIPLRSQVYPVSTYTRVTTPYPVSLNDFVSGDASKVQLSINIHDATLDQYPVKLRMKLSSSSVTITTSGSYNPQPIYLSAGDNLTLDALDLEAYFAVANLDFSGYSKSQYVQNGYLPEGVYQLSFEVLHYTRNYVISSSTPAYIYIYVNSPPLLNLPANKKQMDVTGTQNILFSWAFNHSVYSYPGFSPEYVFEMWEVYPATLDPAAVAISSQPIFTQTQSATSLTYTDAEPLLETGHKYCWRVRVTDPEGVAVFKNSGYSAVYSFTYGVYCDPPVLKLSDSTASSISVGWEPPQTMSNYYLRYVPAADTTGDWYGTSTQDLEAKVNNLDASTKYYLEVKGKCGTQESDYSNRISVTTKKDVSYQCGGASTTVPPDNTSLLTTLKVGDIIKAGDFEVEVASVKGTSTFTGKGYVLVPYFNFIKLIATLDNIQVNTKYQLTSGTITTIYDIKNSLSLNLTDLVNMLQDDTKTEENSFTEVCSSELEVEGDNVTVTTDKDGNTVVNGKTVSSSTSGYTSVTTNSGTAYVVDNTTKTLYEQSTTDGEAPRSSVLSTDTPSASSDSSAVSTYTVNFSQHPKQGGGFDAPGTNTPDGNYGTSTAGGETTKIPWKSMLSGGVDKVMATITGTPYDSVFFSRESAQMVMKSSADNANQRQILVNGDDDQDNDQLFAWYRQITKTQSIDTAKKDTTTTSTSKYFKAGAINLVSYEKLHVDLVLVSVNGSTMPDNLDYMQGMLDSIYAPAYVSWTLTSDTLNVELVNSDDVANADQTYLDNTDADDNMNLTYQEKLVAKAMKKRSNYDSDKYYLFFFNSGKDNTVNGYMPFKSHFGYIFKNNQYPDEIIRNIAHEPAHGVFRLRHTFSLKNKYVQTQGSTNNLMDYVLKNQANTSHRLYKYQWDYIHDPETMLFASWEDEEEGEIFNNEKKIKILFEKIRYGWVSKKDFNLNYSDFTETIGGNIGYGANLSNSELTILGLGKIKNIEITLPPKENFTIYPELSQTLETITKDNYTIIKIKSTSDDLEIKVAKDDASKLFSYLFPLIGLDVWKETAKNLIYSINTSDLYSYPIEALEELNVIYRERYLQILSSHSLTENWFGSINTEQLVVQTIATTPDNQIESLIGFLSTDKTMITLCKGLDNLGGDDNYTLFINELFKLYYKKFSYKLNKNIIFPDNLIFEWMDKGLGDKLTYKVEFYSNNIISFKWKYKQDYYTSPIYLSPFDVIGVNFITNPNLMEIPSNKRFVIMPAFVLAWLVNEDNNLDAKLKLDISIKLLEVAFAYYEVKTIATTTKTFIKALRYIDLARTGTNLLLVDDDVKNKIKKLDGGEDFLKKYDNISEIWEYSDFTVNLFNGKIESFTIFTQAWDKMVDSNKDIDLTTKYPQFYKLVNQIKEGLK
jgi:hypothetical protein